MKKITFILFLGFSLVVSNVFSQGFQVTNGGVDYTNGHYYVWFDSNDSIAIGSGGDYDGFLIKNTGSLAKSVKIKKDESNALPLTSSFICWAACYPTSVNITPDPITIDPGITKSDLILDFNSGGVLGESVIKYTAFDEANPSTDFVDFYVHYQASPTGIKSIANSQAKFLDLFPNPAFNNVKVNYNVPQGQSYIEIHNMLGEIKQFINLSAGSKTTDFSVEDFPAGIYFLTLKVNGNVADTKKLIVK